MPAFDRIVVLQERVVSRDQFGGEVVSWAALDTVWANVLTRNQTAETWESNSNRERATRTAAMRIRWRDDVDETMRIVFDGLAWDIEGIAEVGFRRETEIYAVADTGQAVATHPFTVLGGLSADAIPTAAELTIMAAGNKLALPAQTNQHHLVARLESEPDITAIVLASDPTRLNQIGAYSKYSSTVSVSGQDYNVWVSNQAITHVAETLELA